MDALIAADKARIALPFDRAAAIDLAGRNVLDAVKVSVNPRVIQTPNVSAVAKDGIELISTARVTVRANLERGSSVGRVRRRLSPASARASSRQSAPRTRIKRLLEKPRLHLENGARERFRRRHRL